MSVNLPPVPPMPPIPPLSTNRDPDKANAENARNNKIYDQQLMQYQEAMARYNRNLQMLQQMQTEKSTRDTNMLKSSHDAMMAIASNLKS